MNPDISRAMQLVIRQVRDFFIRLLILVVRIYQVTLSPILGGQCKYIPSCSNYFIEALRRHGPIKGLALGLWRILRCNPFSRGGYDPIKTK